MEGFSFEVVSHLDMQKADETLFPLILRILKYETRISEPLSLAKAARLAEGRICIPESETGDWMHHQIGDGYVGKKMEIRFRFPLHARENVREMCVRIARKYGETPAHPAMAGVVIASLRSFDFSQFGIGQMWSFGTTVSPFPVEQINFELDCTRGKFSLWTSSPMNPCVMPLATMKVIDD